MEVDSNPAEVPDSSSTGARGQKRRAAKQSDGTGAKKVCKSCGQSGCARKSHSVCPVNGKEPAAFTSSGSARKPRAAPQTASGPAPMAFSAWTMNPCPDEYELKFEDDARDELLLKRAISYSETVVKKLSDFAGKCSKVPLADMDEVDVFLLVAKPALRQLLGWLNDNLGPDEKAMSFEEMLRFVGCFVYAQLVGVSLKHAMKLLGYTLCYEFGPPASQRVLAAEQVQTIAQAMTMVNPRGPMSHAEGMWRQSDDTVTKWREYENCVYKESRSLFVNRRLALVIDDELIGSRSKEAGSKALGKRRARKEGIENDCVSESLFGAVLTTRHKARASYSVIESVEAVLDDVAEELGGNLDGVLGTCDRGYSNTRQIWELFVRKGLQFLLISDNSGHPIETLSSMRGKVGAALVREERQAAGAEARKAANESLRETVEAAALHPGDIMKQLRSALIQRAKASAAAKVQSMLDEDVLESAVRLGLVRDKDFVVHDNAFMGREIFSATCTATDAAENSSKLTAFAFVDNQRAGEDKANVVRFVAHGFSDKAVKDMSATFTMTKHRLPQGCNAERHVLFFPAVDRKCASLCAAEAAASRAARPLTCWQRSAEWHVLRSFVITGATGAQLARKDKEASKLVSVRAAREALASGCGCEGLDIGDDDDDLEACCSDADLDQVNEVVEDESALSDYEESDIDESCNRLEEAFDNADGLTKSEEAAQQLFQSWFGLFRSMPAMKSGTMSEDTILQSLKSVSWCKAIFEVGLCASLSHPFLAVSADAIARVVPPDESSAVYAACEFKTRVAERHKQISARIGKKYGEYFACTVGNAVWWRVVPWECRGQLIHQAMVFDFDHVLFVAATTTQICYSVLVHVPRSARGTYCQALSGYKDLLTWAHDSVDIKGPPPEVPEAFGSYRHTVASHLRLWRAVRKRVDQALLPPIYKFKTMPQVLYNSLRGGSLHGSAQYVEARRSPESTKLGLDSSVALRGIKQLVRNAFILNCFRKAGLCQDEPPMTVSMVRSHMNSSEPLGNFATDLAVRLVARSTDTVAGLPPKSPAGRPNLLLTAEEIEEALKGIPSQTKGVRKFFNEGTPRSVRLCAAYGHKRKAIGVKVVEKVVKSKNGDGDKVVTRREQKHLRCVVCSMLASYTCEVCRVALHVTRKNGHAQGELTCWDKFHLNKRLL